VEKIHEYRGEREESHRWEPFQGKNRGVWNSGRTKQLNGGITKRSDNSEEGRRYKKKLKLKMVHLKDSLAPDNRRREGSTYYSFAARRGVEKER